MESRRKLELSKETLRCLTSDLPTERLVDVRGGADQSLNTCLDCVTTAIEATLLGCVTPGIAATLIDTDCWPTR